MKEYIDALLCGLIICKMRSREGVRTRLYRVPSIGKYTRTVYCVLGRMARSVNSTRTYYRVMMITRGDLEYEIPNNEA